ncbi:elongation factor Ts [Candidatus Falkowbacteria bacterium]|nr:elongation factor Ts [Candidatus Falkowbacteria bacterium]
MSIDIKLITKLRELTGAGIADCKSALEESGGDIDKAIEALRKKGALKAAKKSERATNEGVIAIRQEGNKAAVVGVAAETDFVARNEDFIKAIDEFAQKLSAVGEEDFRSWAEEKIRNELIVKLGENIQLVIAEILEGGVVGIYLHSNKKLGAAVILNGGNVKLASELAMQVTAMAPIYIKPEDVPTEELEKETEIYRERLKAEGKPEEMWDKIIAGKLEKYYQEVCLLNQAFIKDDKLSIEQLIKQSGDNVSVVKFSRYAI